LATASGEGRRLVVKFGVDPTAADVHVGHAVPMIIASRFQRMGHQVVFIVGDITAKIGDPSGRTADRPPLADDDIRANMATYRQQVTPFFDFTRADFRYNSEWLAPITLPEFIGVLEKLPVAASLQREDFRRRLAAGSGLTMAELVYSVVMALDSVKINADIELGGLDQLLNTLLASDVTAALHGIDQARPQPGTGKAGRRGRRAAPGYRSARKGPGSIPPRRGRRDRHPRKPAEGP
jgi:tyrosyl-tRNA synthetase